MKSGNHRRVRCQRCRVCYGGGHHPDGAGAALLNLCGRPHGLSRCTDDPHCPTYYTAALCKSNARRACPVMRMGVYTDDVRALWDDKAREGRRHTGYWTACNWTALSTKLTSQPKQGSFWHSSVRQRELISLKWHRTTYEMRQLRLCVKRRLLFLSGAAVTTGN
jgi:hypothetical protein